MSRRMTIAFGMLVGAILGAGIGFCLGKFLVPALTWGSSAIKDTDPVGVLGGWIGMILGGIAGARQGTGMYRKRRRKVDSARRREKYADKLAEFEADKGKYDQPDDEWDSVERLPKRRDDKTKNGFESPWP